MYLFLFLYDIYLWLFVKVAGIDRENYKYVLYVKYLLISTVLERYNLCIVDVMEQFVIFFFFIVEKHNRKEIYFWCK